MKQFYYIFIISYLLILSGCSSIQQDSSEYITDFTTGQLQTISYPAGTYSDQSLARDNPFFQKYTQNLKNKGETEEYNTSSEYSSFYEEGATMPSLKIQYNNDEYLVTHKGVGKYKTREYNTHYTILKNGKEIYTFEANIITDDPFKNFVVDKYGRRLLYNKNKNTENGDPQLIRNGINISQKYNYAEVFNLTKFGTDQVFYFYKTATDPNQIKYYFHGDSHTTKFNTIIHDKCCEAGVFNIENRRDGKIYFRGVQAGKLYFNEGKIQNIHYKEKRNPDWTNKELTTCKKIDHTKNNKSYNNIISQFKKRWKEDSLQYMEETIFNISYGGNIDFFCANEDNSSIIGYGSGKSPLYFQLRDKKSDYYQVTQGKTTYLEHIDQAGKYRKDNNNPVYTHFKKYLKEKSKLQGLGEKNGSKIKFNNYGVIIDDEYGIKKGLFSPEILKWCKNGLTEGGNHSICFVDAFYSWDLNTNIITEEKICPYAIKDNGEIYLLTTCKENKN